jgi:hypothetical protein
MGQNGFFFSVSPQIPQFTLVKKEKVVTLYFDLRYVSAILSIKRR